MNQEHIPLKRYEYEVSRRTTSVNDVSPDLRYFDTGYVLSNSFVLTTNLNEYIVMTSPRGNVCHLITRKK